MKTEHIRIIRSGNIWISNFEQQNNNSIYFSLHTQCTRCTKKENRMRSNRSSPTKGQPGWCWPVSFWCPLSSCFFLLNKRPKIQLNRASSFKEIVRSLCFELKSFRKKKHGRPSKVFNLTLLNANHKMVQWKPLRLAFLKAGERRLRLWPSKGFEDQVRSQ